MDCIVVGMLLQGTGKGYEICNSLKPSKWHCAAVYALQDWTTLESCHIHTAITSSSIAGAQCICPFCGLLLQGIVDWLYTLRCRQSRTILFASECFVPFSWLDQSSGLTKTEKEAHTFCHSAITSLRELTVQAWAMYSFDFLAQAVWFPLAIKEDFRFADIYLV